MRDETFPIRRKISFEGGENGRQDPAYTLSHFFAVNTAEQGNNTPVLGFLLTCRAGSSRLSHAKMEASAPL